MPDYAAIFAYYQAITSCAITGALPGECEIFARAEFLVVIQQFLDPAERHYLTSANELGRELRLRKGAARFRTWQAANPDIVELLRRKALGAAIAQPAELARAA